MNETEIISELKTAIIEGNSEEAINIVKMAIERSIDLKHLTSEAIIKGAEEVGEKYENDEYFLSDMLLAADAINDSMDIIRPMLKEEQQEKKGKVLIGTTEGDLHDIGKSLIIALLNGQGVDVVDLGVDVTPEEFLDAAKKEHPDVIGLSGLLTLSISKMIETVILLKDEGINAKIIVGGGILSEKSCKRIGADDWTKDGWEGVKKIIKLLEGRKIAV